MTTATISRTDWLRPTVYFYGGALAVVGLATLGLSGFGHWTALIPLGLGVAALLAGFGARARLYGEMASAWTAVAICAIALLGTLTAVPQLPYALAGAVANPGAAISRASTALVSIAGLVALGVAMLSRRRAQAA